MAKAETASAVPENLKPFFQRASEAEDRLSRLEAALSRKQDSGNEEHLTKISELESKLEAALATNKDSGNEEHLKKINELESKLEATNAELRSEREKTKTLDEESTKLKYRIKHLVRAFEELDQK